MCKKYDAELNAEILENEEENNQAIPRKYYRNKRTRYLRRIHKTKKLYKATKRYYGAGVYFDKWKNRLVRYSVNSASVRADCNRRFRRRLNNGRYETVANGGAYRKHEEYWWSII